MNESTGTFSGSQRPRVFRPEGLHEPRVLNRLRRAHIEQQGDLTHRRPLQQMLIADFGDPARI